MDHSQLNHDQMSLMGLTPDSQHEQQQQPQQQQQQQEQQQPQQQQQQPQPQQQQQGVDDNALSTAKAALAAQHSPESKYPPPDSFQNDPAALAHGLGGYPSDNVNQHVNQVMMSQIPDQSGTPQHHPQPGQLSHVPQVTQTQSVAASATTTAPPSAQTPPAVVGQPGHMPQQIAMSQQPQASQTANAIYAARESVSQKPNVGSPEWHAIRKNNHKEGKFGMVSVCFYCVSNC